MDKAEFMQAMNFVLEHDNKDEQMFVLVASLKETESDMETATMICAEKNSFARKIFLRYMFCAKSVSKQNSNRNKS